MPFVVDGEPANVDVRWDEGGTQVVLLEGLAGAEVDAGNRPTKVVLSDGRAYALCDLQQTEVAWPTFNASGEGEGGGDGSIVAPITGRVAQLFVTVGDAVAKGDRVAIIEAMKMEHVLIAPGDGTVVAVEAQEGEQLAEGAIVARLEPEATQ